MADESNECVPLVEKVRDWLSTEGYPMEFAVADMARRAGFNATMGTYIKWPDGTQREIDVQAAVPGEMVDAQHVVSIGASLIIECKYSKQAPWVGLCPQTFLHTGVFGFNCLTPICRSVISEAALRFKVKMFELDYLLGLRNVLVCHSVKQALKRPSGDDRDPPFNAICKVAQASVSAWDGLSESFAGVNRLASKRFHAVGLSIPCVIVDAPLFAAMYNTETGDMAVTEVPVLRVHSAFGQQGVVYVVTLAGAFEFMQQTSVLLRQFVSDCKGWCSAPGFTTAFAAAGRTTK